MLQSKQSGLARMGQMMYPKKKTNNWQPKELWSEDTFTEPANTVTFESINKNDKHLDISHKKKRRF